MIERRPFNELAAVDHGWLKAKHHFSFGDYEDATRMGWGSLRVWNDDEIAPNTGFPPHPTPTWKSSPMSARARSPTRTASETKAEPRRATCK
jgi:hypothetical protein